jgi:hypothetical protein
VSVKLGSALPRGDQFYLLTVSLLFARLSRQSFAKSGQFSQALSLLPNIYFSLSDFSLEVRFGGSRWRHR